jgi:hypothetical protein
MNIYAFSHLYFVFIEFYIKLFRAIISYVLYRVLIIEIVF